MEHSKSNAHACLDIGSSEKRKCGAIWDHSLENDHAVKRGFNFTELTESRGCGVSALAMIPNGICNAR